MSETSSETLSNPEAAAYAVDYESFYDKEYSLKTMSTYAYVYDTRFDAYLVAVRGPDIRWVGAPKDFDWMSISGKPLLMHNASFDGLVMQRLQRDGIIPSGFVTGPTFDTADLAAFLRVPRNLDGASKHLLGHGLDKAMREMAKGKTGKEMLEGLDKDRLLAYGIGDADATYELWCKYGSQWPEPEREMSRLNREAAWYGVNVDVEKLDRDIKTLQTQLFEAQEAIPWKDEAPLLSHKAGRLEARKHGIWFPASLAKDSPDFQRWLKEFGEKHPWAKAMGDWRRINTLLQKFKNLRAGLRPDNAFVYQIKYHGAATARMSGGGDSGGKFNLQNMPRDEMFDVDLRGCFTARPGNSLVIVDFAQIEPRVLAWTTKDRLMLDQIRGGMEIYETYARTYLGYNLPISLKDAAKGDKQYDRLRRMCKSVVIGAGYGAGAKTFIGTAERLCGLVLTLEEGQRIISEYRARKAGVVQHWRNHQYILSLSADRRDPVHEVELPSGRILSYYEPKRVPPKEPGGMPGFQARPVRGEPFKNIYGSLIVENETQAIARDVLRDAWLRLARAGFRVLFTVHDEFVLEVPDSNLSNSVPAIEEIICTAPTWMKSCPIDVETTVAKTYVKD